MRQLYLHIGYPKTGTTALQSFLAMNAGRLRQHGILYPQTGRIHNAHYHLAFSLGLGRSNDPEPVPPPPVLRQALAREVEDSGCQRIIVSAENFVTARQINVVKRLFAEFDIRIVIYLRRHDHYLVSAYSQGIKGTPDPKWPPGIEGFLVWHFATSRIPTDYLATINHWATAFGRKNIIVRPYERGQNRPDIYADFLDAIGASDTEPLPRPDNPEINPSITPRIARAIEEIRRTALPDAIKFHIVGRLAELRLPAEAGQHYLSPAMRWAMIAPHRHQYQLIARNFLHRADGVLFQEPDPDPAEPWPEPPAASTRELLELVLRAAYPHAGEA